MAGLFPLPQWAPSQINAEFPPSANMPANVGDMLLWDSSNNSPAPISCQANLSSNLLMQRAIAANFVGVSNSQLLSTANMANTAVRVLIDGIYEFPCDANTFAIGDYVGANVTANAANAQKVEKVSFEYLAVGRVVKRYSANTSTVKCRIMSRYHLGQLTSPARDIGGVGKGITANVASLGGNPTLTIADKPSQVLNASGANRTLTLPNHSFSQGLQFYIRNSCTATHNIAVQDDASTALVTINPGKTALAYCDDNGWQAILGS